MIKFAKVILMLSMSFALLYGSSILYSEKREQERIKDYYKDCFFYCYYYTLDYTMSKSPWAEERIKELKEKAAEEGFKYSEIELMAGDAAECARIRIKEEREALIEHELANQLCD